MDDSTIRRLNDINRRFYEVTADEFDQTRGASWPGWEELLPYLKQGTGSDVFSVLDVGCGNGRFGGFLAQRLRGAIDYHGVDSNPALLAHARQALESLSGVRSKLEERDVVTSPLEDGQYNLVVMFGLMHHIPGYDHRRVFVRQMAERVKPGGWMAFACWRFYEYERFKKRIIPWPDDLAGTVEPHDYLLDWRRGAVAWRYCHYVDDAEHAALVTASGLTEIHTFRADGFTGAVNKYSVLKKQNDR